MKLICEKLLNGETKLLNLTLTSSPPLNYGAFLKTTPGVGKPFFVWPSIASGTLAACDFSNAPIVTADAATNNALIEAITIDPSEVLTYV